MPRMPLIEYEEPAESVLTDDTCVTEPVDTVRRERAVRPGRSAARAGASTETKTLALPTRSLREQSEPEQAAAQLHGMADPTGGTCLAAGPVLREQNLEPGAMPY